MGKPTSPSLVSLLVFLLAIWLTVCHAESPQETAAEIKGDKRSAFRADLGKRDAGGSNNVAEPKRAAFRLNAQDGDEKRASSFRADLGKRTFRMDLGKRDDGSDVDADHAKRAAFRADLGKRFNFNLGKRYKFDLGKRYKFDLGKRYKFDLGKREQDEGMLDDNELNAEKRLFRQDLGKRADSQSAVFNYPEEKRSAFRADLGKRSSFRADLGKRNAGDDAHSRQKRYVLDDNDFLGDDVLDFQDKRGNWHSGKGFVDDYSNDDVDKRAMFRTDLGKRANFRADLGKRAYFKYDLGKRAFRFDLGKRAFYKSDLGKRPYNMDLGKRSNMDWKRLFRTDLGK